MPIGSNVKDITFQNVDKLLIGHAYSIKEAWDDRAEIIRMLTGHRVTPTGLSNLRTALRKIWKRDYGKPAPRSLFQEEPDDKPENTANVMKKGVWLTQSEITMLLKLLEEAEKTPARFRVIKNLQAVKASQY